MSRFLERLKQAFRDEEYRHSYADEFLNTYIATQIKTLREQHRPPWRQEDLAREAGMQQAVISRLENINYGSWSINTLRKLTRAFDVRLRVSFETFGSLVSEFENFSTQSLARVSFSDDPVFQERDRRTDDAIPASALGALTPSQNVQSLLVQRALSSQTGSEDRQFVPGKVPTLGPGALAAASFGKGACGSTQRDQSQIYLAI